MIQQDPRQNDTLERDPIRGSSFKKPPASANEVSTELHGAEEASV